MDTLVQRVHAVSPAEGFKEVLFRASLSIARPLSGRSKGFRVLMPKRKCLTNWQRSTESRRWLSLPRRLLKQSQDETWSSFLRHERCVYPWS